MKEQAVVGWILWQWMGCIKKEMDKRQEKLKRQGKSKVQMLMTGTRKVIWEIRTGTRAGIGTDNRTGKKKITGTHITIGTRLHVRTYLY
jgi:hypothetical protein